MNQEIEQLKAEIEEANDNADWWHNRYEAQVKINKDKQDRIDKAIEYINEAIEDTDIAEVINTDKLLNILKGDNNE